MADSDWAIEPFDRRRHDRGTFDCGNESLNEWLVKTAGQHQRRDLSRTHVLVEVDGTEVMGYYAVSNHCVRYELLSREQAKGLPKIDVPVVLLGRLAVDRRVRRQGLGELLLLHALKKVERLAEAVGCRAVEVDAIDDAAVAFYEKYGFTPLADTPRHLYLPVSQVRTLILSGP